MRRITGGGAAILRTSVIACLVVLTGVSACSTPLAKSPSASATTTTSPTTTPLPEPAGEPPPVPVDGTKLTIRVAAVLDGSFVVTLSTQ